MLPPALRSPRGLALAFRRGSPCCLDRVRGSAKLVRGDMRDGPGLARSVGGISCCSTQVPGRAHRMATRGASLHHLDLATHPGAGMIDRLTRSRVLGLSRLEKVKNVLCARCRPQSEEMVIRVGEGPTAADRHETRVSDLREDHVATSITCIRPTPQGGAHATRHAPERTSEPGGRSRAGDRFEGFNWPGRVGSWWLARSAAVGPDTADVRDPVVGQRTLAGEPRPLPRLAAQRTVPIGHLQLGQVFPDPPLHQRGVHQRDDDPVPQEPGDAGPAATCRLGDGRAPRPPGSIPGPG